MCHLVEIGLSNLYNLSDALHSDFIQRILIIIDVIEVELGAFYVSILSR